MSTENEEPRFHVMYDHLFVEDHLSWSWDDETASFHNLTDAREFAESIRDKQNYRNVKILQEIE